MLNYISEEKRNEIIKDYGLRRVYLLSVAIFSVVCVSVLYIVPLYFISASRIKSLENSISASAVRLPEGSKKIKDELRVASQLLNVLRDQNINFSPVEYINKIIAEKSANIKIVGFKITPQTSDNHKDIIEIQGISDSRNALRDFTKNLEKNPEFQGLDLPLSSFTKDNNIPFNLTITVNK